MRIISKKAMLFAVAMLLASLVQACLSVVVWYYQIPILLFSPIAYAQKRPSKPIIHDRKFALFPCSGGHGPI